MLEHNHSSKYWKHVECHVPNWRECRKWLKHNQLANGFYLNHAQWHNQRFELSSVLFSKRILSCHIFLLQSLCPWAFTVVLISNCVSVPLQPSKPPNRIVLPCIEAYSAVCSPWVCTATSGCLKDFLCKTRSIVPFLRFKQHFFDRDHIERNTLQVESGACGREN